MHAFYRLFLRVRDLPVPVIACLNGHAIGAGLCFAMACDIRVASVSARKIPGNSADVDSALSCPGARHFLTPTELEGPDGGGVPSRLTSEARRKRRWYEFRNATEREVIYRLMLVPQRQRLHSQISDWYHRCSPSCLSLPPH